MRISTKLRFLLFPTLCLILWKVWPRTTHENIHFWPEFNESSVGIPQILHQTFKSELIYSNYQPLINSCLSLNPNWTYYLWRDSDAVALITRHYPHFLAKYHSYTDGLERSDSIRYIVLHHFGGIYIDMDVECRRPFFPALSGIHAFLDQERREQSNIIWGRHHNVMNSAMGSAPGHPFFHRVIDEMLKVRQVGRAVDSTGPGLLNRVYAEFAAANANSSALIRLLEPQVMSPRTGPDLTWFQKICRDALPQGSRAAEPVQRLSWLQRGCLKLRAKNWSLDDTDNATICVHRFLHLGYDFAAGSRKHLFNATRFYWPRVRHYAAPITWH